MTRVGGPAGALGEQDAGQTEAGQTERDCDCCGEAEAGPTETETALQRCDPSVHQIGKLSVSECALDQNPCQQCLAAGLDCTYGQIEKGVYTRTRPYGVVSGVDERLAKVERALLAKLDSAGYVEVPAIKLEHDFAEKDVEPEVGCLSSSGPSLSRYAYDSVATISAAFDFAASFLPPNPATSGRYNIGLTSPRPGKEHLRTVLKQHEAELFPLDLVSAPLTPPQPQDPPHRRRSSVASSTSSFNCGSSSDYAVPDTPVTSVDGSPPRQRLPSLAERTPSSHSICEITTVIKKEKAEQRPPLPSSPLPLLPPLSSVPLPLHLPPMLLPSAVPSRLDAVAHLAYGTAASVYRGAQPCHLPQLSDPAHSRPLPPPQPPVFPQATHYNPFYEYARPAAPVSAALLPRSTLLLPPFPYPF